MGENFSLKNLKTSFERLQKKYKDPTTPPKLDTQDDILYYFFCRFPATSKVLEKVFGEFISLCRDYQVETMLDIGAGPLSATLQALDHFPTLKSCVAIEKNPLFHEFAKKHWEENRCHLVQERADFTQIEKFPSADLAVFSYSLSEAPRHKQAEIAKRAFESAQHLIIIEPGTPHHNRALLEVRDALIQEGAHLIAPCPHSLQCPLAKTDTWCHFSARLARSSIHRQIKGGELGYEDEKYFYMIFSKAFHHQVDNRIISPLRKDKQGIHVEVCAKNFLGEKIFKKGDPNYKELSKNHWGESFKDL